MKPISLLPGHLTHLTACLLLVLSSSARAATLYFDTFLKRHILSLRQVLSALLTGGVLAASLFRASAQEARFFRVVGPVPTTIIGVTPGGWVTCTNKPIKATFVVQVCSALQPTPNWRDYIQVPATNAVTVHRIFDPNPPAGMVLIPAGSFTMGNCMDPYN